MYVSCSYVCHVISQSAFIKETTSEMASWTSLIETDVVKSSPLKIVGCKQLFAYNTQFSDGTLLYCPVTSTKPVNFVSFLVNCCFLRARVQYMAACASEVLL